MAWDLLTDDQILTEMAKRFDELRKERELTDEELARRGGTSRTVLNKFRGGGGITLTSFIRLMRGLGALDQFELILPGRRAYRPSEQPELKLPTRIRKKRNRGNAGDFRWGDEK